MCEFKKVIQIMFKKIYDELLYPILIINAILMAVRVATLVFHAKFYSSPLPSTKSWSLSYRQLFLILQWPKYLLLTQTQLNNS